MALFASTSPSYLILQSLDAVNPLLEGEYPERLLRTASRVAKLKSALTSQGWELLPSDALKITLCPKPAGYTGLGLSGILAEHRLICEFADPDHLVLMITPETDEETLLKLEHCLGSVPHREPIHSCPPVPAVPEPVLRPREAVLLPSAEIPVEESTGRILAAPGVSCPPAVPIVLCGERIDGTAVQMFRYYGIRTCRVVINKISR